MPGPRWLHLLLAAAVLAGSAMVGLVATVALALHRPAAMVAAWLAIGAVCLFTVRPLVLGSWGADVLRFVQPAAAVTVLAGAVVISVFVGEWAREGIAGRAVYAESSGTLLLYLGLSLCAAGTAIGLLAALPVGSRRWVRRGVLGALALIGVLGAGATIAIAAGGGCRGFHVDRDAWRRDREAVAEAIDRCGGLEGLREEQVHALLGAPPSLGSEQVWIIDSWLDILDEPHSDRFTVTFDADGRVRSAAVSYWVSG